MLKKIDCVMLFVDDIETATKFYVEVFGLRRLWQDESSVGLGFPETDAEIVLHTNPNIPARIEVYYLVDNVIDAVQTYEQKGCRILVAPFSIPIGQCAVIQDPFGTRLCILDMSKGPRQTL